MKTGWIFLSLVLMAACSRQGVDPMEKADGKHDAAIIPQEQFRDEVLKAEGVVVVDFYADWCGPCKRIAPVLEELAQVYEGRIKVVKINVDHSPELAEQYQVRSIPTFFAFRDGHVLDGTQGALSRKHFEAWFDSLLEMPSEKR